MSKIRILFIIPRFGTINRGVESFVFELVSRLNMDLFEVTILSARHFINIPGIIYIQKNVIKREQINYLELLPGLIKKILSKISLSSPADIESLTLVTNSVNMIFDGIKYDIAIPIGGTWTYRFGRHIARNVLSIGQAGPVAKDLSLSDVFIALTSYDKDRALAMNINLPIYVIPNGISFKRFNTNTSIQTTKANVKTILCVAALTSDKRHDLLFNAVLLLPDFIQILCVGSGPLQSKLEKHQLFLSGRVTFRTIEYNAIHEVYKQANIFSLASPDEAFGIVFLEAMASGLPIVCFNGPRQQSIIDNAAFYCNVFDPVEYSKTILRALSIGINNEGLVRSKIFDWDIIVSKYEEIFSKINNGCDEKIMIKENRIKW